MPKGVFTAPEEVDMILPENSDPGSATHWDVLRVERNNIHKVPE